MLEAAGLTSESCVISLVPWPPALVASMAAQQAANYLILSLALGWFYRD